MMSKYLSRKKNAGLVVALAISMFSQSCDTADPSTARTESAGNINTIAGIAGQFDFKGDGGQALVSTLGYLTGISVDATGNIYVVDAAANVLRRIDHGSGVIATLAGKFVGFNVIDPTPNFGDGGPALSAHLNVPMGVAVDADGNIYIADSGNNVVRKIDGTSGIISRVAGKGNGSSGYSGDGGPANSAAVNNPYDVAVDASGNLFIAESQNHCIRRVDVATGIITTVAGSGPGNQGFGGDNGTAITAKLNSPQAVTVDSNGNLYIVDSGNHRVRKVTASSGVITTIAGTGDYGYSGDGGPGTSAELYAPSGIAVDNNGDVYIADQGSHVIRKITMATGVINTWAGKGTSGYSGDGGEATEATMTSPQAVAVNADGDVIITDTGNSVIRVVTH